MHFIEALKLRSKIFFLFVLITLGLFAVGIMGTVYINEMKKNLDSLYFGSLVPVTELNEILQTYHSGLAGTIYKAKTSQINALESTQQIEISLKVINKLWKSYESHFKREDELGYVEYTSLEIKSVNEYFNNILNAHKKGVEYKTLSIEILEENISFIHSVLQKLINYEVEVAKFERKKFLNKYHDILIEVGVILFFIIIAILFISYNVFKSIQLDHTKLEVATKRLTRANKKLENVSYTDSLTSLHNRRYFNLVFDRELQRAKRTHSFITFMMLDIDYFKQYNDTYGHIEGDFALKSVAKVLKDTLQRPSDFVFRLGGEEFGVLLTQTDKDDSAALAQKICDSVLSREIKHEGSKVSKHLSISIGLISCIADDTLNGDTLISRADKMLYEAKENGRNRYVLTTELSDEEVTDTDSDRV